MVLDTRPELIKYLTFGSNALLRYMEEREGIVMFSFKELQVET